jgi:hypothetical protein
MVCPETHLTVNVGSSSANLAKAIPILSTSALVLGSIAIPLVQGISYSRIIGVFHHTMYLQF